jgi:hypothetical protein
VSRPIRVQAGTCGVRRVWMVSAAANALNASPSPVCAGVSVACRRRTHQTHPDIVTADDANHPLHRRPHRRLTTQPLPENRRAGASVAGVLIPATL